MFTRNQIAALSVAAVTAAFAGTAFAQSAPQTTTDGVSIGTIAAQFEARGERIHDIDRDGSIYEVEYVTANGQRMEAGVEVATGKILYSHPDR